MFGACVRFAFALAFVILAETWSGCRQWLRGSSADLEDELARRRALRGRG